MSQLVRLGTSTYTIHDDLGNGAFGDVMLAEDKDGDPVAIKIVPDDRWNHNELIAMYLLDHPGILKLYDYQRLRQEHALIVEYFPDGDLFDYVEECLYLDEPVARKYFRQILLALRVAHKKHIYHGDLRLENILIDVEGDQVVIADWGLSSFTSEVKTKHLLLTEYCVGYQPPEFFTRKRLSREKLDIWMVGTMLYSAIAGYFPFEGPDAIKNTIAGKYTTPDAISPELADLFQRIFQPEATRISLVEMIYHPWFQCETASLDALLDPN